MKMSSRALLAIWVCRLLRTGSRLLHRGGTALPGKAAQKLCPDLLSRLSDNVTTVAVTGTNGKTTCSCMIEEAFREAGVSYFCQPLRRKPHERRDYRICDECGCLRPDEEADRRD